MQLKLSESRSPWAILLLIAPFFFWGTAMVAMKGVIPNTTPLFMAGVRLLPAGILVLAVAVILNRPQPKGWAAWLWISFFALLDGTLFQGFLAEGLVRTSAGLGSVMIDSQPLAVALMSAWLFGEVIGLWGWLGLGLGVLGISLIGLPDEWILNLFHIGTTAFPIGIQQVFEQGQWLMLLAALSMAVGTITIRFVCRYADPVAATAWHMILGGVPLFIGSGIWESDQWVHLDMANWAALGYSTIFGSAIAYGLFFYYASRGNLTSLSALTFLTPVFALLFGNLILSEVLSPLQWIGVCLTLVSIYFINQRQAISEKLRSLAMQAGLSQQQIGETQPALEPATTAKISSLEVSEPQITSISVPVNESDAEMLPHS